MLTKLDCTYFLNAFFVIYVFTDEICEVVKNIFGKHEYISLPLFQYCVCECYRRTYFENIVFI
jgi:hypothetical protein